jgi:hypothetical protein
MNEQATETSTAPRLSGEFIRQALLGEVPLPPDSPLKLDSRGARLEGVIVEGGLDLSAVKYDRPIAFERCTFEGPIVLRNARLGPVSLARSRARYCDARSAAITGDFDCAGVELHSPEQFDDVFGAQQGRYAFIGWEMEVSGSLSLNDGFHASGAVSLVAARIGNHLVCNGGVFRLAFPVSPEVAWYMPSNAALAGHRARIGDSVFLLGARIEGLVNFIGARIGGDVVLLGARIAAAKGVTAQAPQLAIQDVSGRLVHRFASGFVLTNSQISGSFIPSSVDFEGVLLLRSAQIHAIADDGTLWRNPETGKAKDTVAIDLDDCRYEAFVDSLATHTDASWRTRLAFLHAQPREHLAENFLSQPFTQCAEVLRNMGDSRGARMILFERERLRLKAKNVGFWEKLGGRVLGALAGYGYKNHYALYWALGVWLAGALVFGLADRLGEMRPASEHVLVERDYKITGLPPADYEPLNAAFYSADLLLPIVDIGQERYWIPRNAGERAADARAAFPRLPHSLVPAVNWLFGGWLPKAYYYFEIAMGWLLVSIVIAGFSGLLGHAREE